MNIFFVASIHGKDEFEKRYREIVDVVKSLGHKIEADHILNVSKTELNEWDDKQDLEFHKKVLEGVKKTDIVIGELSYSSTSVGYLLSLAVEAGKPTIVIYGGPKEPHLLQTLAQEEKFQAISLDSTQDLAKDIEYALEYASDHQDTRFNFFISPKHQNYLDWISKHRKIPRAVFLRNLIEIEMDKDEEFKG